MTTHGSGYGREDGRGENKKGVRDLFGVWTVGRSMYNTYRGEKGGMEGEEPLTLAMIAPEGIGSSAGGPPSMGRPRRKIRRRPFGILAKACLALMVIW